MKKLFLLLLLCPLMAMADFLPGTLTFNDGSTKSGFIEIPLANSPKIKYRITEKGNNEKFSIDEIKSYTVTNKEGKTLNYLTLNLAQPKTFQKEYKIDKKKSWLRIEKAGKINILSAYYSAPGGSGFDFFVYKPWESHCYYVNTVYGGFTTTIGEFNAVKKYCEVIFKDDCQKLAESLTKEDFKENGLFIIVDNFEQLCGSSK